jgi:hypothetical protein
MIIALKLPKGRNTLFKAVSAKLLIPLTEGDIISLKWHIFKLTTPCDTPTGCMLVLPTIDLPPTSFGTHDNMYSNMLVDTMTSNPVTAHILMAYFTRAGDKLEVTGDHDDSTQIKLDFAPLQ